MADSPALLRERPHGKSLVPYLHNYCKKVKFEEIKCNDSKDIWTVKIRAGDFLGCGEGQNTHEAKQKAAMAVIRQVHGWAEDEAYLSGIPLGEVVQHSSVLRLSERAWNLGWPQPAYTFLESSSSGAAVTALVRLGVLTETGEGVSKAHAQHAAAEQLWRMTTTHQLTPFPKVGKARECVGWLDKYARNAGLRQPKYTFTVKDTPGFLFKNENHSIWIATVEFGEIKKTVHERSQKFAKYAAAEALWRHIRDHPIPDRLQAGTESGHTEAPRQQPLTSPSAATPNANGISDREFKTLKILSSGHPEWGAPIFRFVNGVTCEMVLDGRLVLVDMAGLDKPHARWLAAALMLGTLLQAGSLQSKELHAVEVDRDIDSEGPHRQPEPSFSTSTQGAPTERQAHIAMKSALDNKSLIPYLYDYCSKNKLHVSFNDHKIRGSRDHPIYVMWCHAGNRNGKFSGRGEGMSRIEAKENAALVVIWRIRGWTEADAKLIGILSPRDNIRMRDYITMVMERARQKGWPQPTYTYAQSKESRIHRERWTATVKLLEIKETGEGVSKHHATYTAAKVLWRRIEHVLPCQKPETSLAALSLEDEPRQTRQPKRMPEPRQILEPQQTPEPQQVTEPQQIPEPQQTLGIRQIPEPQQMTESLHMPGPLPRVEPEQNLEPPQTPESLWRLETQRKPAPKLKPESQAECQSTPEPCASSGILPASSGTLPATGISGKQYNALKKLALTHPEWDAPVFRYINGMACEMVLAGHTVRVDMTGLDKPHARWLAAAHMLDTLLQRDETYMAGPVCAEELPEGEEGGGDAERAHTVTHHPHLIYI